MRNGLSDEDIALIYDTAVDRSLWPTLLERVADAVGGVTTTLGTRNMRTGGVNGVFIRTDAAAYEKYWTYPFEKIPLNAAAWARVGTFVSDEQQVPKAKLVQTDYFQNFLRPTDIGPVLTGVLRRDDETRWTVNLSRPLGAEPFGPAELDYTSRIVPHLVRMAAVSTRLADADLMARTAEAALDQLPSGVVLVDARGKILFANREAQAIAAARDGLIFAFHGVVADRADDSAALARAIGRAAMSPGEGATLRLARPTGARPLAVLVVPVRQDTDWLGNTVARAMVVVTDPERGHVPPEKRLARLYGLTPSEAAMAVHLLQGRDLAEIAERRSISVATARLHLHRILGKTGTARQAELIQLMFRESLGVR